MNGGYVTIDCTGLDLTKGSTQQTIPGLYNRVKEAMRSNKEIQAVNCLYGAGKEVTPISVFAIQEAEDTIICTASILQVIVKSNDKVTVASLVTLNSSKTKGEKA